MLNGGISLPVPQASLALPDGDYMIAFRPHHLYLDAPSGNAVAVKARVVVTEITGSESFVHVDFADVRWVALMHGVRDVAPDEIITVYLLPERFFIFDASGALASAPDVKRAA